MAVRAARALVQRRPGLPIRSYSLSPRLPLLRCLDADPLSSSGPSHPTTRRSPATLQEGRARRAERLRAAPIGSLSAAELHEAAEAAGYWARQGTSVGAKEAAAIVNRLLDEQEWRQRSSRGSGPVIPSTDLLNSVIDSHRMRSGSETDDRPRGSHARGAERLLARVEGNAPADGGGGASALTLPDHRTYNMVIDAHSKLGDPASAEKLLRRMSDQSLADPACRPYTITYNTLLNAYANSANSADAPQNAERLLQTMQDLSDGGNPDVRPDAVSFASVITTWARSNQEGAAQRAEAILRRMIALSTDEDRPELAPNSVCYTSAIDAWSKSGAADSAQKAMEIFQLMATEAGGPGPDTVSCTSLIDALAKGGDGPEHAERVVRGMLSEPAGGIRPNTATFTALIDAYARSGKRGAAERAEAILDEMMLLYQAGDTSLAPTTVSWNATINAWSKSADRNAGVRAQKLLDRMNALYSSGVSFVRPDEFSYCSVIDSWSESGDRNAGHKAEELLNELEDASIRPNLICYSSALNAWVAGRDRDGARRAELLLKRMESLYRDGEKALKPNAFCFNIVLNAHAKAGDAKSAERFLAYMEDLYSSGKNEDTRPTSISFSAVIDSWARSGRKDAPERALKIFRRSKEFIVPSVPVRNTVINVWAKAAASRPDAAGRAEALLREMIDSGDEQLLPTRVSFNTCMDAWAKSRHPEAPQKCESLLREMESLRSLTGHAYLRADKVSYTCVMSAWARSKDKGGAERAEMILNHMQSLYERNSDEDVRPNVISFSTVISAWARRKDPKAALRAISILEWMEKLYESGHNTDARPNAIACNSVINAIQKSKLSDAAERAEMLLKKMRKAYGEGNHDMKPTLVTFNSVIACLASSKMEDALVKASSIIREMTLLSDEGDISVRPDVVTYTSYINVLARSRDEKKASNAWKILLNMEEKGDNPNAFTFDAVIRACAFSNRFGHESKRQAIRIALECLERARKASDLDASRISPSVYDTFFMACSNLAKGKEYERLLRHTFALCCEDGMLNAQILKRLHQTASPNLLSSMLGTGRSSVADLPFSWSRNAARSSPKKRLARRGPEVGRALRIDRPRAHARRD